MSAIGACGGSYVVASLFRCESHVPPDRGSQGVDVTRSRRHKESTSQGVVSRTPRRTQRSEVHVKTNAFAVFRQLGWCVRDSDVVGCAPVALRGRAAAVLAGGHRVGLRSAAECATPPAPTSRHPAVPAALQPRASGRLRVTSKRAGRRRPLRLPSRGAAPGYYSGAMASEA